MRKPETSADEGAFTFLNARLIDPATGKDEPGGLLVRDGIIADMGPHLRRNAPDGTQVIVRGDGRAVAIAVTPA